MSFDTETRDQAAALLERCREGGVMVATAESCTGGMIAACLTEIGGSSDVFERGFVTYSNEAKMELLGVPAPLIARVGAVSEEVARAMAEGAIAHARADLAVAVTGVAGPSGGTPQKPVGLVHLAGASRDGRSVHERHVFPGDRGAIRLATVQRALAILSRLAGPT